MHFHWAVKCSPVSIPVSRHISGEKKQIYQKWNYREPMPRHESAGTNEWQSNEQLVAPILVWELQKKRVKGSVNTLGSMYAIKAEYKYSHVWLSEKTNMHIKNPSCSIQSPPETIQVEYKVVFIEKYSNYGQRSCHSPIKQLFLIDIF